MKLKDYRQKIDEIDRSILMLLIDRKKISEKIGDYKSVEGLSVEDLDREMKILENVCNACDSESDKNYIKEIFSSIIKESKKVQNG